MSQNNNPTVIMLLSVSSSAIGLMILLLIALFGIEPLIDVAPTVIFLGVWLPLTYFQTKNLEYNLREHMIHDLAAEFADVEFKRSFFLEACVIQAVYALIIAFRFGNISLEWILLGIVGSLSFVGYRFSNPSRRSLSPILGIPVCSIIMGEAGYILAGNKDSISNLVMFSMVGFIASDVYYLLFTNIKKLIPLPKTNH